MRHILSQHQVCFTHDDDMHLNECQMKLRSFAAIRRNLSVWLTMDFGFHFRFVRKWRTEKFPRLLVRWRKSQSIEPNIDSNGNRAERCHITYYRYCYACIYWIYFVFFSYIQHYALMNRKKNSIGWNWCGCRRANSFTNTRFHEWMIVS